MLRGTGRAVGYVAITSAPFGYAAYPSTYYDGRIVYFVDGRWGYPYGDRWVYYQHEPPPLARYRVELHRPLPAGGYYYRPGFGHPPPPPPRPGPYAPPRYAPHPAPPRR